MSISEGSDLSIRALIHDEPTLHEATFDTADDQDHFDLDLLDPSVFAALVNEVKTLLTRADYGPAPVDPKGLRSQGPTEAAAYDREFGLTAQKVRERFAAEDAARAGGRAQR